MRADHHEPLEDDDEDAEDDDLPGLYYPLAYVLKTWWNFREHHILPDTGAWSDQDWRLVEHDWSVVNARYNRMDAQLYPDTERGNGAVRMPEPGEAPNWMDMLK